MTSDDLMDMLPQAVYLRDGTLVISTHHERIMKAAGIDVKLLLVCIEDNTYDDDDLGYEEIDYSDAVDDYFREKPSKGDGQ